LTTWYGSRAIEPWKNAQKSDEFLKRFPPFRSGATDANRVGRDSNSESFLNPIFVVSGSQKQLGFRKISQSALPKKTVSQPKKMLSFNPPT